VEGVKGLIFSRKANVFAAVFVIMIVLAAVGVVTYTRFMPKEESFDYGKTLSEAHNVFERVFYLCNGLMISSGMMPGNALWYCNAGYPPTYDNIKSEFEKLLAEQIAAVKANLSGEGYQANLSEPIITIDYTDPTNPKLVMSDFFLTLKSQGEVRVLNFSGIDIVFDDYLNKFYPTIVDWLEDDAGGLMLKLKALNDGKPCKLSSCCCYNEVNKTTLFNTLHEEGDMTQDELNGVISASIKELDELFKARDINATCNVSYSESIILIENEPFISYSKNDCPPAGTCAPNAQSGGTLCEWSDEDKTLPEEGCPVGREKVSAFVLPADLGSLLNNPPPASLEDYIINYRFSLHRKAAANIAITCKDKDKPFKDPFIFRIRFAVKYYCDYPPDPTTYYEDMLCGPPGPPPPAPCDEGQECDFRNCHKWICDANSECTIDGGVDLGRDCGADECNGKCDANGNCAGNGGPCSERYCGSSYRTGICNSDSRCQITYTPPGTCCGGTLYTSWGKCCQGVWFSNGQCPPGDIS
jgi:hypothetical protein